MCVLLPSSARATESCSVPTLSKLISVSPFLPVAHPFSAELRGSSISMSKDAEVNRSVKASEGVPFPVRQQKRMRSCDKRESTDPPSAVVPRKGRKRQRTSTCGRAKGLWGADAVTSSLSRNTAHAALERGRAQSSSEGCLGGPSRNSTDRLREGDERRPEKEGMLSAWIESGNWSSNEDSSHRAALLRWRGMDDKLMRVMDESVYGDDFELNRLCSSSPCGPDASLVKIDTRDKGYVLTDTDLPTGPAFSVGA